jgi:hypothetical protein
VEVTPDPTGDFQALLQPQPANPGAKPTNCGYKQKKAWNKLDQACRTWTGKHTAFEEAKPRVVAAIHAAEAHLGHPIPNPIHVLLKSGYHEHAEYDDLWHWTFNFHAPACGAGPCVGHAYAEGEVRQARIFSAAHKTIFGVSALFKKTSKTVC